MISAVKRILNYHWDLRFQYWD